MGAVAVGLIGAAPFLVNSEGVKNAVEQRFAQAVGGELSYRSASLDLFPRPRVSLSEVTANVPGAVDGKIAALHVTVAWLPLLQGTVHPTAVRIEQPVLRVNIPSTGTQTSGGYRAVLGPLVDALIRNASGMSIAIDGGQADIAYGGQHRVSLSKLDLAAEISDDEISATLSAAADAWRAARGHVKLSPGSLAATAHLELAGLQTQRLFEAAPADASLRLRIDDVDFTLDAATDGTSAVNASLTGSAPRAVVTRAGRSLALGAIRVSLDARRDGEAMTLGLRVLRIGDLLDAATGSLRAKADGSFPVLEMTVPELDLKRAGAAALALAGDLGAVRATVDTLQQGTAQELRLDAAAREFAALTDASALRVSARLSAATVAVPAAALTVENGSGRMLIADGVLQGSELAGTIDRSSFTSGSLALALRPQVSLRSLRANIEADLTKGLAVAMHVLREDAGPLANIEALRGRASTTIDYDAGRKTSPFVLTLKGVQANGRYRGLPFPLTVSHGALHYSGNTLSVDELAGSVGGSTLTRGAIDLDVGRVPAIRTASGDASLLLDEIHPWIASLEAAQPALEAIESLTGSAAIHLNRLSGVLSEPGALEFDATVAPQRALLKIKALPAPLSLTAGSVNATPRALRLDGLQLAMLDAKATVSGTASNYTAPERRVSLSLSQGSSGAEAIAWASRQWKLPPEGLPRAPIALSDGRIEGTSGAFAVQGSGSIAGSVQANFDLAWQPGHFDLRRLALRDADSDATLRLLWSPAMAELGFKGRLHHRTIERSLAEPPHTQGRLEGDFRASVDLAQPERSGAEGTLEVEGLDLREHAGVPLAIDRLKMDASGRTLRVQDSAVRLAGERFTLSGTVQGGGERLVVDARVAADAVDAAHLLRAFSRVQPATPTADAAWNLPVDGRIAITANSIAYDEYALKPITATVRLESNLIVVDATDAQLCGIQVPFTATLVPGNVSISARGTARNQPLADVVPCLGRKDFSATGTYDLDVAVSSSGPAAGLLASARGSFRVAAHAGRIHQSTTLSRTLSVDEVAARTQAKSTDMLAKGIEYREISLAGALEDGRVRLDHGMLDSPSLGITANGEIDVGNGNLSLQGLVAPLDRFNRVMNRTVFMGKAFGGSAIVVIPVSIRGSITDPQVKVLAAAAVGSTLVNLMSATFLTPVRLFDSATGRSQEER